MKSLTRKEDALALIDYLKHLYETNDAVKDLRLGQLLSYTARHSCCLDIFYVESDELLHALKVAFDDSLKLDAEPKK